MKTKYYVKACASPLNFQISTSGRSISLSSREELKDPLTYDEFNSNDIKRLIETGNLKLLNK